MLLQGGRGGDDLADLQANADAAQSKYGQVGIKEIAHPVTGYFKLLPLRPNPMSTETTIGYQIPRECKVTLKIYDIVGRLTRTLINAVEEKGYKTIVWDGTNNRGCRVAPGVYFCRLQAGDFTYTRKVITLR